jgi:uncharacterized integral membrane protein (TIGR00698 family)
MSAKLDFATRSSLARLAPGVGLCLGVATLAWGAAGGRECAVRQGLGGSAGPGHSHRRGDPNLPRSAARGLRGRHLRRQAFLEIAVVLLGASVSAKALEAASPILLLGVVGLVLTSIAFSFAVGRVLGLTRSMAMLVACGNSICGNSAIATVAPVIDAKCDDVAAAIGFTAVFGVAGVLLLPPLGFALGLGPASYGAFAGLTVYAVPQVIAAAAPAGSLAVQTGTLVKLVRVMMLGPVCLLLSLVMRRRRGAGLAKPAQLLPWFIVGFFAVAALKLWGVIPQAVTAPAGQAATLLTVVSMAALGLGVDVRVIARAGPRVIGAVLISLLGLSAMSLALLAALRIA